MSATTAILGQAFESDRRFLWGLCYRMTGCAADADDLVQETFVRAIEHPPARTDEALRPWLVRVAMNLARDALRRRKRRAYVGPWLPSPIETEAEPPAYEIPGGDHATTEGRYELMESVSFAFLLALEALTPQQRAVLLLRDVFDYSVRETADALGLSEPNVKTTHHRARRAMREYDRSRAVPSRASCETTRRVLERFLTGLQTQDVAAVEKLLADDVRFVSDGGGEYLAALHPVVGRAKVARFYVRGSSRPGTVEAMEMRTLNGFPAVLVTFGLLRPRQARFGVVQCVVGADGRITALHNVLASRKLTAIRFEASPFNESAAPESPV